MKLPQLAKLTIAQLVELFKKLSFEQAINVDSPKIYGRALDQVQAVSQELRRRGPEARRALLPLLDCTGSEAGVWKSIVAGAHCRLNAADELLAIEPERARATLIALGKNYAAQYQMGLANGILQALNNGSLKPT
jgi:hypothetical protein